MIRKSWLTFFVIGSLFLCACHSKNDLQVSSKNFESEIEQQQNLIFQFNKDIFPDSLVGLWDTTAYIDISPAVKGKFKWNSSSELVFSPAEGFAPGTEYTAHLTKALIAKSARKYSFSSDAIAFHTAPLRVTSTHLLWTRGKNTSNVMVQMDMGFNYDVDLATAASKLKLSSGGNNISMAAVNTGSGKVLSVQFMPVNDKDEETPLKVVLASGIPVSGSKYVSTGDTTINAGIPSRYVLAVTDVSAQHDGTDGSITVTFSQPVTEQNLKGMITLEPQVPFDVSVTDAGFVLTSSKFNPSQTYQLNISKSIEGVFGGRMKSEYSGQVSFGKLAPTITFANTKGYYLSSAGFRNLALNIVNVSDVEVSVIKVYENNLEQFMRREKDYNYSYDEDEHEGHEYQYYQAENLGDTIYHQSYETSKLPKLNAARVLHLDFQDKIKSYNGIYILRVASKQQNWVQDSKIITLSDIGMIVKEEKDNIYVFANSIKNATAMAGVSVSFISTNNQKLYTATTDDEGMAVFRNISAQSPGFKVGMITGKMGDDFTFVWMPMCKIGTSRFDVGGRIPNDAGLNAMIYGERNLYRPGETIHLSAIVRDETWERPGEVPVKIRLNMPNGKEFSTVRKILNEEGSCEVSFPVPATALTGTYTAYLYTGNDVLLNTYAISVEEFMPDRMKVSLNLNKEQYAPGEPINARVQADNLFGTPAADKDYECELNMQKTDFTAKNFPDYNFAVNADFQFTTDLRKGKTDAKGGAMETFKPENVSSVGLLNGNIMATVFDETGRPVHRYSHFQVFTQPCFVGIKNSETYVSTKTPVRLDLVATDKNGKPVTSEAQVTVLRKEWHSVIQQEGSSYRYVSQSEDHIVSRNLVKISGTNTGFTTVLQESGEYEVRIFANGSNSYVSKHFYAWGWGDTHYTSFEVDNEGNVEIKPDKPKYNIGDNMNILFTTPFEGRMLVTVERDHVLQHYYFDTRNKSASLSLKASDEHIPNVYITATLIRPMGSDNMPLTVAHGFKSLSVENKQNHIPLKLAMQEKSRSKKMQTISVQTTPGAMVTIAAVDEGILQVKNFQTPDPYQHFYQKVALAVNSYDIYPWLLPELKTTLSSSGGDGSEQSNMRVNPIFANRVKLVSFWSGVRQADGSGHVQFDIDVPQFSGDIRVMATAYKGKAFGSTDNHMKVADPVVISTALPRFLSPKDQVIMPVSLSNTTNNASNATVTVTTTGPMGVVGESTQTVSLPANRESRVVFNIAAQPAIGAGKVTVSVKALGETFVNETEMGVRPPASLQKITDGGFAAANTTQNIDLKNNFIPSSISGKIVIAKSPVAQFTKNLGDLVHYPYGCVEQTTSAAFPQLYYADLVKSATGNNNTDESPAYNVQQAINKLQSMQLSNGALSYWPGGNYESWWGSIYAAHFLLEARKAGYDVNAGTVDRLMQYMKFRLYKKETETFYFNNTMHKEIAPEEVPYSLYVLALAGQSQQATMNYYKAHNELLTLDGRYMLGAAYALSGQPMQAKQVMPPAFAGEIPDHSFSGSFYSYIRDEALSLDVLMDIDPANPQVGVMSRHLVEQLRKEYYLSTQENVFSLLALGKVARAANATSGTATLYADGKKIGSTDGQPFTVNSHDYAGKQLSIKVSGKGGFYYSWQLAGISSDGTIKQEDSYLRVRRTFYDRNGHEISGNTFRQNDLVVVCLSIETEHNTDVDNVAITDMLPAGFEIENTRLNEMPNMSWMKTDDQPDYIDIRDDRINMFTKVSSRKRNFYYMVRAVSPGTYQLGPVQADAMYDGTYHSYNGAGVVRITDK